MPVVGLVATLRPGQKRGRLRKTDCERSCWEGYIFSRVKLLIRNRLVRRLGVPEIPPALERLWINNFRPTSIFDVGAYSGEFAKLCRKIWPLAKLTCFEVLPHRVAELRRWCDQDGNAIIIESLMGAKSHRGVPFTRWRPLRLYWRNILLRPRRCDFTRCRRSMKLWN